MGANCSATVGRVVEEYREQGMDMRWVFLTGLSYYYCHCAGDELMTAGDQALMASITMGGVDVRLGSIIPVNDSIPSTTSPSSPLCLLVYLRSIEA